MAVFPTPASPMRQGLDLRRRPSVRRHIRISFSRPYTASKRPSFAISVKSIPTFSSVGVDPPALPPTSITSLSRISVTCAPLATTLFCISLAKLRQNCVPSNARATGESSVVFFNTANAAHLETSSVATLYRSSYSSNANNTCPGSTSDPGDILSAMATESLSAFLTAGENGNSDEPCVVAVLPGYISIMIDSAAFKAPSGDMPKLVNILRASMSFAPAERTIPTSSISLSSVFKPTFTLASWEYDIAFITPSERRSMGLAAGVDMNNLVAEVAALCTYSCCDTTNPVDLN
mmetsp:Transcript_22323/g.34289  ORF Transcript_22323/g.34289 Transcript_22323/m.34289 type:complete len:291 (+) Transcript_22323:1499-2371(+)